MKQFMCFVTVILSMLLSLHIYAEPVWIDVRSALEHKIDNIEGDMRVPHSDIVEVVAKSFPDKETDIRLYCRSGGRAGKAQSALKDAGYKNVQNVGSIDDARAKRGVNK